MDFRGGSSRLGPFGESHCTGHPALTVLHGVCVSVCVCVSVTLFQQCVLQESVLMMGGG